MGQYKPQDFERKWQERWQQKKIYHTPNPGDLDFDTKKPSYYVLDMFPYPSGSGLHVGHASGYIGTDIIARRKRMEGYNVLHPMGWDAFGLPAEQYAIQTGQHPRITTEENAKNFRKQLQLLGLSYDWDREIDTSAPEYYRWTQWLFLKLYEKGLVYQKEVAVWWCEDLKTVLANEEVISGRSERGNHPCVRRPLKQWVLKITEYADRLIQDLELLDWPEHIKKMQLDWIGRSEGAEIDFRLPNSECRIRVFSTRPDTLFGVTALVLAPEHPWVTELTAQDYKQTVQDYIKSAASKSDRDRKAEAREISGAFLGSYALHPLIPDHKVPIYIADYVIADYGTGAVMSVPAHDERDFLFAQGNQSHQGASSSAQAAHATQAAPTALNIKLPMVRVIIPANANISATGSSNNSANNSANGSTNGSAEGDVIHCFTEDGVLVNSGIYTGLNSSEARTKIIDALEKNGLGERKITFKLKDWVFSRQRYWGEPFPVSFAPDGSMVPAHESELPIVLPDMKDFTPNEDGSAPLARVPEWVHFKSAFHPGVDLQRSTDTMPGWAGSCWYYLRFMDPHNAKAPFSPEAVKYWQQVDLYVGGTAHAVMHLLYARFWHKVFFDLKIVPTAEPFKKLFNQGLVTAFGFKDSTGRMVPSDEIEATGHEWKRKTTGETVERFITKMSKSLKNVVNPDDVIRTNGCDALRIYEMFMGPLADDKPWTDDGLPGCERFLRRVWNLFHEEDDSIKAHLLLNTAASSASIAASGSSASLASLTSTADAKIRLAVDQALHRGLKRINDSFANFNFNTSVAAMMEIINAVYENEQSLTQQQAEMFLRLLSPFCPHIAAEIWEKMGHQSYIDYQPWPEVIESYLQDENFEFVISVNGKPRRREQVRRGTPAPELEAIAKQSLSEVIAGQTIVKVIVVLDKLVNVVVKG
jgi:leucyl-tRNA synthetase